jgi:hypothetical protein
LARALTEMNVTSGRNGRISAKQEFNPPRHERISPKSQYRNLDEDLFHVLVLKFVKERISLSLFSYQNPEMKDKLPANSCKPTFGKFSWGRFLDELNLFHTTSL